MVNKTAYLDSNVIVDIEQDYLSIENLIENVDSKIKVFFYSSAHIQEATEMTAVNDDELRNRIEKRFATISSITDNNYLYMELPSYKIIVLKEKPSVVYNIINFSSLGVSAMKSFISVVSETQKQHFRNQIGIDSRKINNYSSTEIIEHINSKSDLMGGYSFIGMLEKAIELHPQGAEMGIGNNFAAIFEFLDLVGYWKDKFNEKSNYARLWDSNHAYYSSQCDYFISDDKRTRNKAKVVFKFYEIESKIVSSNGAE